MRGRYGHGLFTADVELRLGPVGMIIIDVVSFVLDNENQIFHAGYIDVHFLGGLVLFHHATLPKIAAVADQREADTGRLVGHFVIDADKSGEARRAAFQVDAKQAGRMGSQSVLILCARDCHGVAVDRLVGLRLSPILLSLADIE